jgi:hypothetical protein
LTTIDKKIATELAKHNGTLYLTWLTTISEEVKTILKSNKNIISRLL